MRTKTKIRGCLSHRRWCLSNYSNITFCERDRIIKLGTQNNGMRLKVFGMPWWWGPRMSNDDDDVRQCHDGDFGWAMMIMLKGPWWAMMMRMVTLGEQWSWWWLDSVMMVTLDEHGLLMQQKLPLWLLLLQTPWCQENHPPDGHHHYDYGIDDDDVDQWSSPLW